MGRRAETNRSETHVADSKGGRSPACVSCLWCAYFAGGFVSIWSVFSNINYFPTKLQFVISLSGLVGTFSTYRVIFTVAEWNASEILPSKCYEAPIYSKSSSVLNWITVLQHLVWFENISNIGGGFEMVNLWQADGIIPSLSIVITYQIKWKCCWKLNSMDIFSFALYQFHWKLISLYWLISLIRYIIEKSGIQFVISV